MKDRRQESVEAIPESKFGTTGTNFFTKAVRRFASMCIPFTDNYMPLFDQVNQLAAGEKYKASFDFPKDLKENGLKSASAYKNYLDERKTSITALKDLKTPDGELVSDKLKGTDPSVVKFKEIYKEAMQLDSATKDALERFKNEIEALNELVKEKPPKYDIAAVAAYLTELSASMKATLDNQHKAEIERVTKLFEPPHKASTMAAMGLDEEDLEKFKTTKLEALKKSQEQEIKKFENILSEESTRLHEHKTDEMRRVFMLNTAYLRDEEARNLLDEKIREIQKTLNISEEDKAVGFTMGEKNGERYAKFTDLKLNDITMLKTFLGTNVEMGEDGKSLNIKLPKFMNDDQTLEEATFLAFTLKAMGFNQITTNISVDPHDQKKAEKLAMMAFEAALLAGFDPTEPPPPKKKDDPAPKGHIIIRVNITGETKDYTGKEIKEVIFAKNPELYERLLAENQARKDKREAHRKAKESTAEFKQELKEIKTKVDEKIAEKNAQPGTGNAGRTPQTGPQ